MLLIVMVIAQPALETIDDVERLQLTTSPCRAGANPKTGEIVVCGKPSQGYRIGPVDNKPRPALPPAQVRLSENVTAKIGVEQEDIGGWPSQRAMVSLKIRF